MTDRLDRADARAAAILQVKRNLLDRVAVRLDAEGYLSADDVSEVAVEALVWEAAK